MQEVSLFQLFLPVSDNPTYCFRSQFETKSRQELLDNAPSPQHGAGGNFARTKPKYNLESSLLILLLDYLILHQPTLTQKIPPSMVSGPAGC